MLLLMLLLTSDVTKYVYVENAMLLNVPFDCSLKYLLPSEYLNNMLSHMSKHEFIRGLQD